MLMYCNVFVLLDSYKSVVTSNDDSDMESDRESHMDSGNFSFSYVFFTVEETVSCYIFCIVHVHVCHRDPCNSPRRVLKSLFSVGTCQFKKKNQFLQSSEFSKMS